MKSLKSFLALGFITLTYFQLVAFTLPQAKVSVLTAKFQWSTTAVNVGQIKQNVPKVIEFTFTNVGDAPLMLTEVKGSCGCTATDYTREPIMPNGTGKITATYNAASIGQFTKTVTVSSNVGDPVVLSISGEVIP